MASRRQLAYWTGAALAAVVAPLAGHAVISGAIDGALVPALERATGESARVDQVDVSLLGSVAVIGLGLGDFISVDRVEGRVALGSILDARLSADEIEIERPRIELRQGGRRLRALVRRLHASRQRSAQTTAETARPRARWPRLRVSGGEMRIRDQRGAITLRGLRARPIAAGLRLITDSVEISVEVRGRPLSVRFARAAADLDTGGARLARAVALGGSGAWGEVAIDAASAIRDHRGLRARAQIDGGEIELRESGGSASIDFTAIPATAIAPLAGSLELARGTLSGSATLSGDRLRAQVKLAGVTGYHRWLAGEPVDLSSDIGVDLGLVRRGETTGLDVREVTVRRGALSAHLRGALTAGARGSGNLTLALDRAPCASLLASLPPELAGALRGTRLGGELEARFDLRFDLSLPAAEALELAVELAPSSCQVHEESPRFEAGLAASRPVKLSSLPGHVPAAFLAAEDSGFYRHAGFERRQIELSLAENLQASRLLRGGSTITQQLAKNLFLGPQRTLARKLQEAVFAWRLEERHEKREILAHYLGIIQLGVEVHGLEAAARHWFAKPASRLSPREAAFLACLTRAPATLERSIRANGGPAPALARRIDALLASLRFAGAISMPAYREAMATELELAPLRVAAR
jgi:hypothetical protein